MLMLFAMVRIPLNESTALEIVAISFAISSIFCTVTWGTAHPRGTIRASYLAVLGSSRGTSEVSCYEPLNCKVEPKNVSIMVISKIEAYTKLLPE